MSSAIVALKAGLSSTIELTDVICPVCLSVFVEPVQLPCSHVLCMPCFNTNLDKTSLCCPICRERIGSWCRKATKQGTLVEQNLWAFVQEKFASRVASRLAGREDEDSDEISISPNHQLVDSGEVGAEFSAEVARLREEEAVEKAEEEARSMELARRLMEEERAEQEEQEKREQREKLERRRSRHRPITPSTFHPPNIKKRRTLQTDIESSPFTKPDLGRKAVATNLSRCPSTESNNSIDSELTHFRPIRVAPISPPKKLADGSLERPTLVLSKPTKNLFNDSPPLISPVNSDTSLHCSESLCSSTPSTSNLPSRRNTPDPAVSFKSSEDESSTSVQNSKLNHDQFTVDDSELERKLKQERQDEELAKRLQEELNNEATRPPDRRKGSQDEYQLRQTPNRQTVSIEDSPSSETRSRGIKKTFSARKRFRTEDYDTDEDSRKKRKRDSVPLESSKSLKQTLISKFVHASSSISIV